MIKKRFLIALLLISLLFPYAMTAYADESEDSKFEIWFLDVGQGDAAVIQCDGYTMMIDGGPAEKSSYIYSFLENHGISRIDYMIATHADGDHIGGLSGALNAAAVGNAYCTVTEADSAPFESLVKYLGKQDCRLMVPNAGDCFSLGTAEVKILAPERGTFATRNTSIVLQIEYGATSFLFTGDAELEDEKALLAENENLQSTVLKVAHHGSDTSTTNEFLDAVNPQYAVISVGGDNDYGHPTQTVLDRLKEREIQIFRTDMQGIIHCVSDGTDVSFDVEKNSDIDTASFAGGYKNDSDAVSDPSLTAAAAAAAASAIAGETKELPQETEAPGIDYVGNMNSMKFHYPSCPSVGKMKESNKYYYTGTREEMIAMGYEPCHNCNP